LAEVVQHLPEACRIIVPTSVYRSRLLPMWVRHRPGTELPQIATMQGWVMDLARACGIEETVMADDEADLLLALAVEEAGEQFRPAGLSVSRIVRWKQEGHTVPGVVNILSSNDSLDVQGIREVTRLTTVWAAYERLKGAGHLDRGDVFQAVADHLEQNPLPADVPTVILATHGATPVDERIVTALAGHGWDVGILFAERTDHTGPDRSNELAGRLMSSGWEADHAEPHPLPDILPLAFPTPREEVRRVIGQIKHDLARGSRPGTVAVVLPTDGGYDVLFREAARQAGVPVVMPDERSLSTTLDASALYAACAVVIRGWEREDVTRLALSGPCLPGQPLPSLLEAADLFRIQGGQGASSWRDRLTAARKALQAIDPTEAADDDRQMRRSFGILRQALHVVEVLERCLPVPPSSISAAAFERWLSSVAAALELPLSDALSDTISWYRRIAEQHHLKDTSLAVHVERWWRIVRGRMVDVSTSGTSGVAVLRAMDVRMAHLDTVYVLGLTDGIMPQRRSDAVEEFFLGSVPQLMDTESWQDVLCAAGEGGQVVLTRSETVDDDDTVPSMFWDDARQWLAQNRVSLPSRSADVLQAADRRLVLSEAEHAAWVGEVLTVAAQTQDGVDRASLDLATQEPLDQAELAPISPSRLDTMLACPYRYWGTRMLRLEQPAISDEMLTPLERGTLMHAVAQRFMQDQQQAPFPEHGTIHDLQRAQVRLAPRPADQLMPALVAAFTDVRQRLPSGYLYDPAEEQAFFDGPDRAGLLRRWLMMELKEQASDDALFPVLFELDIDEPIEIVPGLVERVKLRIDRVDARIDGDQVTIRVVDYKTSSGASPREILNGQSTQMPLYMIAIQQWFQHRGIDVDVDQAAYHIFGKHPFSTSAPRSSTALHYGVGPREKNETVGQLARAIPWVAQGVHAIRSGRYQVVPREGACQYCHLRELCRIEEWGAATIDNESERRP